MTHRSKPPREVARAGDLGASEAEGVGQPRYIERLDRRAYGVGPLGATLREIGRWDVDMPVPDARRDGRKSRRFSEQHDDVTEGGNLRMERKVGCRPPLDGARFGQDRRGGQRNQAPAQASGAKKPAPIRRIALEQLLPANQHAAAETEGDPLGGAPRRDDIAGERHHGRASFGGEPGDQRFELGPGRRAGVERRLLRRAARRGPLTRR